MIARESTLAWTLLFAVVATFAVSFATGCESIVDPEGSDVDITAGECEGSPYGKDMDTGGPVEPEVWAEADGADILLHLDDLTANCCPSPGADIAISGSDISVDFHDVTGDEACNCICVMDFQVRIPDPGSGDYTIDVDHNGVDLDVVEVRVP
jgi:hypothetical protein